MTVNDSRPRVKYVYPDGRPATVICDHGQIPKPMISCELVKSDPLWDTAQPVSAGRRIVWLTLAAGL